MLNIPETIQDSHMVTTDH